MNVYGRERAEPSFEHIANLYAAATVDACFDHSGDGPVQGIKTDKGVWAVAGHLRRIVRVSPQELSIFAQSLDTEGTSAVEARLPALHSTELMAVMRKFADQRRRLRDLESAYVCNSMWHETNAQRDGTIRRKPAFRPTPVNGSCRGLTSLLAILSARLRAGNAS